MEIHVLVYSKQQSMDLLGYIQFISVNPKREFGAQPQQCSTCALTYKLFSILSFVKVSRGVVYIKLTFFLLLLLE